jgi:hypothetical protein
MKLHQLISKFTASTSTSPVCIVDNGVAVEYPDTDRLKVLSNRDGDHSSMRDVESFSVQYGTLQVRLKKERVT